jgi:UDP-N-acetyl-D-mannosaminuronic acid dehydrogenase
MICVPTPFHETKNLEQQGCPVPNLEFVFSAVESIVPLIKPGDIVILESTSPVGTTEMIGEIILRHNIDTNEISIGYCPERVLPGKIMLELLSNDRIIGGLDEQSTLKISNFYKTFIQGRALETNARTAEMCKLAENSYRDINIAYANELSMLSDNNGVDVWDLINLANHHPRVNILQPGAGVGGHCIAVDPWFLVSSDPTNAKLIQCARQINDFKPHWVVQKILLAAAEASKLGEKKMKVACLGLSFKPDIDDLRGSPAISIAKNLQEAGVEVIAVEPNISASKDFDLQSLEEALVNADLFVLLVAHREFTSSLVKSKLQQVRTLDFCGILDN